MNEVKLAIDRERLIAAITEFNREDSARASDASESREAIGSFLEDTGINKKAFSHMRAGLKIQDEAKALDWLRSMEAMLPIVGSQIRGGGTLEMDLSGGGEAENEQEKPARSRKRAEPKDPDVVDFNQQVDRAEAGESVDFAAE